MKLKIALLAACLALAGYSSQAQISAGGTGSIQDLFDVHNTNSLIAASEINISPYGVWRSDDQKAGGGVKLDWWISDQQGAFLAYEEYGDRVSYVNYGYQVRTVFKGLEVGLATGMSQRQGDDFGDVRIYLAPTFTVPLYKSDKWDLRVLAGADLLAKGKPNPFLGVTVRFLRF